MKISSRQLYFLLGCIMPVSKLILLPTELAKYAKNDLLYPFLAQLVLQSVAIFCVLLASKRQKTFYELVEQCVGGIAAKIVCALFALFLIFSSLLPILEQKSFVQSVFYDTLPSIVSFAPFFLFAAYMLSKPIVTQGRMWDILAPIFLVGIFGVLLLSFGAADLGAVLPAGAAGWDGFGRGLMLASSWFFDAAVLTSLLGKTDYVRGMPAKGALAYLGGGLLVALFLAVFYGVFQETAINQLFAFAKPSKYFSGITVLGRIDYLFIFALAMVMSFAAILPAQAGIDLFLSAFQKTPKWAAVLIAVSVAALYFTLSILLDYRFGQVTKAVTGPLFWIFPLFSLLFPILLTAFWRRA